MDAVGQLDAMIHDDTPVVNAPSGISFREFLLDHAWVKAGDGRYERYTFEGRPVLEFIVFLIDRILGNTWWGADHRCHA